MQLNLTPSQLFMEGLEQHCVAVVAEAEDPEFAAMLSEFLREVRGCVETADWTSDSEERFDVLFGRLAKIVWANVAHMQTGTLEAPYELSEVLTAHQERFEP